MKATNVKPKFATESEVSHAAFKKAALYFLIVRETFMKVTKMIIVITSSFSFDFQQSWILVVRESTNFYESHKNEKLVFITESVVSRVTFKKAEFFVSFMWLRGIFANYFIASLDVKGAFLY